MSQIEVIKSPQDKKSYRYLQLPNGLSVLLIHDPDMLPKAGVADENGGVVATHGGSRTLSKRKPAGSNNSSHGSDKEEDSGDMEAAADEDGSSSGSSDGEDDGSDEDEDEEMDSGDDEAGAGGSGDEDEGPARKKNKKGHGGASEMGASKKAAAAMAVGVGSFCDPADLPGLSHFLEHMLFMGSEKYPDENDYDTWITKHAGSTNAFTDLETTNYHFDIAPDALKETLDRFAQFFISPLCLADSLDREVKAVDSEFAGVKQDDHCRVSQLMCHTAVEGHVFNRFTWGNRQSLWEAPQAAGVDVRARVMEYYRQQYSAERMSLVLLGGQPLDELQGWVVDMFARLPTGLGRRPSFSSLPPPFQGRMLYLMPSVKEVHELGIAFPLPCLDAQYRKKAEAYISHLVGHEGPGSLLSALKARGWATELTAGVSEDGFSLNSCFYLFSVNTTLTDAGLAAGPGFGLACVGLLFEHLALLRAAGPQRWVWDEMAALAELRFRFHEEEDGMDLATRLAGSLHLHAPEHALVAEALHEEWDPALISSLLDLMQPSGSSSSYRVDLLSGSYPQLEKQLLGGEGSLSDGAPAMSQREPWFDMTAVSKQLPESLTHAWAATPPSSELHLPPPNPYIPSDFNIKAPSAAAAAKATTAATVNAPVPTATAAAAAVALPGEPPFVPLASPPAMVVQQPGLRLWHKLDSTFDTPRSAAYFRLFSPALHAHPRAAVTLHLALKLLEDALNEDAYLADVAGLSYHTSPEGMAGLEVRVDGYSHKLPLLTLRIFRCLAAASFSATAFNNAKEALVRKYRNMNMQVARHANYTRLYALCAHAWHCEEMLPDLEQLELTDIAPFITSALRSCHVEALIAGNVTLDEAKALASEVHSILGPGCSLLETEIRRDQCVVLPSGPPLLHWLPARNQQEENAAVELYFQCGPSTAHRDRALLDLVDQILDEPLYDSLRTKQQLGYTVQSGARLTHGVLGYAVVVVSAKYPAAYLESCIDTFLVGFEERIAGMTAEELSRHKASLAGRKLVKDRALADEVGRHWEQISSQRYDFFAKEREMASLEALSQSDVLAWFRSHLLPSPTSQRRICIQIRPASQPSAAATGAAVAAGTAVASIAGEAAADMDTDGADAATATVAGGAAPVVVQDLAAFKKGLQLYPALLMPQPSQE